MKSTPHTKNNSTAWRLPNGKLHRDDGPALIEGALGRAGWYQNGLRHNDYGPALVMGSYQYYFLYGKEYTKEVWKSRVFKKRINDYIKII